MKHPDHKPPWGVIVFAVAVTLLVGGTTGYVIKRNTERVSAVTESLVAACESSLKPGGIRYVQAQQIKGEIERTRRTPAKFFPSIPPRTFKNLIAKSVREQEVYRHQLLDINCDELYREDRK